MTLDQWIGLASATVALTAIIVALTIALKQDLWRLKKIKPSLVLEANAVYPDCFFRIASDNGRERDPQPHYYNNYVLRIRIKNKGNQRAENIQVFVMNPIDSKSNAAFPTYHPFHNGLLPWTDPCLSNGIVLYGAVNPGDTFGYVYFAVGNGKGELYAVENFQIHTFPSINDIQTHNSFEPGTYRFPIVLSASNMIGYIEAVIEIHCSGNQVALKEMGPTKEANEAKFLKEHFAMRLISQREVNTL